MAVTCGEYLLLEYYHKISTQDELGFHVCINKLPTFLRLKVFLKSVHTFIHDNMNKFSDYYSNGMNILNRSEYLIKKLAEF